MLQKRGSGQILECLRKWLELQASAGLWASHRCSPPGGEGAAAAHQEEEEEEGGWQLPALLSAGVSPHLCICRVQDKACLCWRCDESRGSQPALGVFLPQLKSKLSAGVFLGPKAEVCTLFKQQHGLGLINYLFAVLVSLLR